MLYKIFRLLLAIILISCTNNKPKVLFQKQQYYYSNIQGNNQIEGDHIYISEIKHDTLFFSADCNQILKNLNKGWILGQGSGKPYYDTGKEFIWHINKILPKLNAVIINGQGIKTDLPVVFWKKDYTPVAFNKSLKNSWGFSKIIFDSTEQKFKTHIFNCDTEVVRISLCESFNLIQWQIKVVLQPKDFENIPWNVAAENGQMKVTPLISDIIKKDGLYYCFAYGDDAKGKTYIGLLTSKDLVNYEIIKDPILSPNPKSRFSAHDVYYPKVVKTDKAYLMFYTAKPNEQHEYINVAISKDLKNWKTIKENIIPRNSGWNSAKYNQLVSQVKLKSDSVIIWTTGAKPVGDYSHPNKGNALDLCIGKFIAHKDSLNFEELPGNPIFGGDPTFALENDHIGGSYQEIYFKNYLYRFYHGKNTTCKNYTILIK